MTLTMAMVTIVGAVYSSTTTAAKWESYDPVHLGYAGAWPAIEKVLAHIDVTKCYESYECILSSYHHKRLHLCVVSNQ
jgi:hypothetical protein